mmetsp:Transcript_91220/g.158149  ORF Transcript_91220/g.158149 Transcript_91220/m.158149 type:complete len:284 (+) Transcript_91220:1365-2216(+)
MQPAARNNLRLATLVLSKLFAWPTLRRFGGLHLQPRVQRASPANLPTAAAWGRLHHCAGAHSLDNLCVVPLQRLEICFVHEILQRHPPVVIEGPDKVPVVGQIGLSKGVAQEGVNLFGSGLWEWLPLLDLRTLRTGRQGTLWAGVCVLSALGLCGLFCISRCSSPPRSCCCCLAVEHLLLFFMSHHAYLTRLPPPLCTFGLEGDVFHPFSLHQCSSPRCHNPLRVDQDVCSPLWASDVPVIRLPDPPCNCPLLDRSTRFSLHIFIQIDRGPLRLLRFRWRLGV